MTPEELELIAADGQLIEADADAFATRFYDTLFEIAPTTRDLFPPDLAAQRGKLVNELAFLVDAAATGAGGGGIDGFVDRARSLGARHLDYGVSGADYAPVGVALIAALRDSIESWSPAHDLAWTKLYGLIADVMREGARTVVR